MPDLIAELPKHSREIARKLSGLRAHIHPSRFEVKQVLEPWIYGASTGVSSFASFVAAVFWTWLWGPIGLILATLLTVCLVVAGKYLPQLSYFSVILGDNEPLCPGREVLSKAARQKSPGCRKPRARSQAPTVGGRNL